MRESKIFVLLRSFSKAEIKRFRRFLLSPYFNRSAKVVKLYEWIVKHHPTFREPQNIIKLFHKKISRTRDYKPSTYRELLFQLTHLVLRFIRYEEVLKKKQLLDYLLTENIRKRSLAGLHNLLLHEFNPDFTESELDAELFYSKYLMEVSKFNWSVQFDKVIKKSKAIFQFQFLNNSSFYLTIFYLTEMISAYIAALIFSEKYNIDRCDTFIEKLMKIIKAEEILGAAKGTQNYEGFIKLYAALLSMFMNFEDTQKFYNYKKEFLKVTNKLTSEESSFHLSKLISYALLKCKLSGTRSVFENEQFELYQILLKGWHNSDNKIRYFSPSLFRDILLLSLSLKRYKWAENFITEFSKLLPPKEREGMANLGYSFYFFSINEFREALKYINKISYDYFIFKYDVKNLKLKIFYELDCLEEALSIIIAYRENLLRDYILTNYNKKKYRNFISIVERLIRFRAGRKKFNKEPMLTQILTQDAVYRDWLFKKLEELELSFYPSCSKQIKKEIPST